MGHWGGVRSVYTHSASGGNFQIVLTRDIQMYAYDDTQAMEG